MFVGHRQEAGASRFDLGTNTGRKHEVRQVEEPEIGNGIGTSRTLMISVAQAIFPEASLARR